MSDHLPHRLGHLGERYARAYLEERGWRVIASNYRFRRKEVDLVVWRRDLRMVAFVEVKTRAGDAFGTPEEAVTRRKQAEIEIVAADYLRRHDMGDIDVRFDVVAVEVGPGSRMEEIRHIEDAWRPQRPR